MDSFIDLCHSFGLPVWIASVLHAASRLRTDHARRKKSYRIIQRKLVLHGVGVTEVHAGQPTYVYPAELKELIRSAFPDNLCDYSDPCHLQVSMGSQNIMVDEVVYVTMEDLHGVC